MLDWLKHLFIPADNPDISQSLIAILLTIGLGVLLGRIRFRKIALGVSGVMFSGLILGHLGYRLSTDVSTFIRDFGLILFVYGIGIQVGPSFFSSFRKEGLKFNLLGAGTVLLGGLVTWLIFYFAHTGIENAVGIMSGAVTNTPGLGAAESTLHEIQHQYPDRNLVDPAIAYAITYPMGVMGIITMILLVRKWFRIDLPSELQLLHAARNKEVETVIRRKCRVLNEPCVGKSIAEILETHALGDIIISRQKHHGTSEVITPSSDTVLQELDVLMVVGLPEAVDRFIEIAGKESSDEQIEAEQDIISKTVFVTRKSASHQTLSELDLFNRFGIQVTRVYRSGMELLAHPTLELFYGDRLRMVGHKKDIDEAARLVGNSEKRLLEPDFLSIFGGMLAGIILGSIPIMIPSLPVPVKLGFAAGPLIVALLISRYGGIGVIHSYINNGAIYFMKDLGICLFFASVGLHAGGDFYESFIAHNGWLWLVYGALITFIPLLIMVLIGRLWMRINFYQLAGLMSGTYTDPAALAFCNGYLDSDVPTQAYATVYPLITILRIFVAQLLILLCI